jgi:hypothetical protein
MQTSSSFQPERPGFSVVFLPASAYNTGREAGRHMVGSLSGREENKADEAEPSEKGYANERMQSLVGRRSDP